MPAPLLRLPDTALAPLMGQYDAALAARRRATLGGLAVFLLVLLVAAFVSEVHPERLFGNAGKFFDYIGRIFYLDDGRFAARDMGEWFWGLKRWLLKIGDTVLIAYLGTLIGALGAFAACFAASANLATSKGALFLMRRVLEFCRTVPELVFALIFVVAFGLGPVPGVLAIAIHTFGALGKLFAEVVENIDLKPVEGATSSGASRWQAIRYAVVPQVLSNFASYALLRFEINVRGAAVMGFVGAGGIGQDLIEAVRKFYYSDVSAILLLIIGTVMLIDLGAERLRHRLLSMEAAR
ncbi:MAG: phosphonate ABC transporter, permease protein PhnE [Proteobacteria bacterium]|nr:phosphonate ABC transporter, permease protein PhnE [Pseudomonadota bacterium]